jgi:hypothetical protein
VDRRFWVTDGRRADFEAAFEPGGIWPELLGRVSGYLSTRVWCESLEPVEYRVKDFWRGHQDFESFRAQFQSEYERFEDWLSSDGVIGKKQFVGNYYEEPGGEDDFADLVL